MYASQNEKENNDFVIVDCELYFLKIKHNITLIVVTILGHSVYIVSNVSTIRQKMFLRKLYSEVVSISPVNNGRYE